MAHKFINVIIYTPKTINTMVLARHTYKHGGFLLASFPELLQTIIHKYVPKALPSGVARSLEDQVARLSSSSTGFFVLVYFEVYRTRFQREKSKACNIIQKFIQSKEVLKLSCTQDEKRLDFQWTNTMYNILRFYSLYR